MKRMRMQIDWTRGANKNVDWGRPFEQTLLLKVLLFYFLNTYETAEKPIVLRWGFSWVVLYFGIELVLFDAL